MLGMSTLAKTLFGRSWEAGAAASPFYEDGMMVVTRMDDKSTMTPASALAREFDTLEQDFGSLACHGARSWRADCSRTRREVAEDRAAVLSRYNHRYDLWVR